MPETKRAIFVYGHKGGVGKSIFAGCTLDYFRRHDIPCAAFDTDSAIRHLFQYYGTRDDRVKPESDDPMVGVSVVNLKQPRARDGLINILDKGYPRILIDMPAGGASDLEEGFGLGSPKALYEEYQKCGYRITIATVITPIFAASEATGAAVATFRTNVDHLVVKNLHFGEMDQYPFFDGYTEKGVLQNADTKKFILAAGGMVVGLPRLRPDTFAMVDRYGLSFSEACEDEVHLERADRSRVFQWRAECDRMLESAGHLLALSKSSVAA